MHVCGSDKDFTWANCLALYFCVAFGCDWSSALESVALRLLFARVSASPERDVLYLTCHIRWFNTRYNINVDLHTYIFSRHNTVFYVLILQTFAYLDNSNTDHNLHSLYSHHMIHSGISSYSLWCEWFMSTWVVTCMFIQIPLSNFCDWLALSVSFCSSASWRME